MRRTRWRRAAGRQAGRRTQTHLLQELFERHLALRHEDDFFNGGLVARELQVPHVAEGHLLQQEFAFNAQLLEEHAPVPLAHGLGLELRHEQVGLEVIPTGGVHARPRRSTVRGLARRAAARATHRRRQLTYRSVLLTNSNAAYCRMRAGTSLSSPTSVSSRARTLRGTTDDHAVSASSWMLVQTRASSVQTPLRSRSSSSIGSSRSSPPRSRLSASLARATCCASSCSRTRRVSKVASVAAATSGLRSPWMGLRWSQSAASSWMRASMAASSCVMRSCSVAAVGQPAPAVPHAHGSASQPRRVQPNPLQKRDISQTYQLGSAERRPCEPGSH